MRQYSKNKAISISKRNPKLDLILNFILITGLVVIGLIDPTNYQHFTRALLIFIGLLLFWQRYILVKLTHDYHLMIPDKNHQK